MGLLVGETSFLAVYNAGDVVYLYKAEGTSSIQTTARLGSRRPAYCTALGKVILANLSIEETDRVFEKKLTKFTEKTISDRLKLYEEFAHIRSDGYAVDDEGIVWMCSYEVGRFDPLTEQFTSAQVGGYTGCMADACEDELCAGVRE